MRWSGCSPAGRPVDDWKQETKMTDQTQGTGATQGAGSGVTPPSGSGATTPWYEGIDTEILGHAQNKGWKLDDPKAAFSEATKAARELQKHFGVPADQLLRLPATTADEAGWKAVHSRLGVPT